MVKLPHVEAIVAALLADGYDPAAIESAVIAELTRLTVGRWRRAHGGHGWGGDWYPLDPATAWSATPATAKEPRMDAGGMQLALLAEE